MIVTIIIIITIVIIIVIVIVIIRIIVIIIIIIFHLYSVYPSIVLVALQYYYKNTVYKILDFYMHVDKTGKFT